ncbi:MAG: hypothetical protein EAZ95_18670 [Bacteroidetes bacterium]|nr:MAG: hypothetical protein EAZ95_18670 [Bacteroidota bacterium]
MPKNVVMPQPVIYAKRTPIHVELILKEGSPPIPHDIYGVAFFTSPVGTVNSDGLPIPATYQNKKGKNVPNPEYGSPIMNGDGNIIRIDFNEQGVVKVSTRLMKTPCYYADEATKQGGEADTRQYKWFGFRNFGIARISLELGGRNELNTAVIPFRFAEDAHIRCLAGYDVGRAFEFNPATMELITPIGKNSEYLPSTPPIINFPFALVETTAHPTFDAITKELFTVNFTKSMQTILGKEAIATAMPHTDTTQNIDYLLQNIEKEVTPQKTRWGKLFHQVGKFFKGLFSGIKQDIKGKMQTIDQVFLMRWNGKQEPLQKWRVLDEQGNNLVIHQCVHQIALTEDYVILSDSSFKFTLGILFVNPFPYEEILNKWLGRMSRLRPALPFFWKGRGRAIVKSIISKYTRWLRQKAFQHMETYTKIYLIRRSDLTPDRETVTAIVFPDETISSETVHFSANYSNPNGEVTIVAAHNNSACLAEWLRPYDIEKISGKPVQRQLLGMFANGAMDIGRVGKYVLDTNTATLKSSKVLYEKGNIDNPSNIGAHTWELGLYTYRDIISPETMVQEITTMYCACYGLDSRMLTEFIYKNYREREGRVIPAEDMLAYTSRDLPHCLVRLNVDEMQIEDYFQFEYDQNVRSIQFVPRKGSQDDKTKAELDQDGYIVVTMVNRVTPDNDQNYVCELWIFDATDLQKPPVKLFHPDFNYGFSLHSVWVREAENLQASSYFIDIQQDYNEVIQSIWRKDRREKIQRFFNQYVYPPFLSKDKS